MEFKLNIKMDNTAFFEHSAKLVVAEALRAVGVKLEEGYIDGQIWDIKGNNVGSFGMREGKSAATEMLRVIGERLKEKNPV